MRMIQLKIKHHLAVNICHHNQGCIIALVLQASEIMTQHCEEGKNVSKSVRVCSGVGGDC